jgi:hypothetical protein
MIYEDERAAQKIDFVVHLGDFIWRGVEHAHPPRRAIVPRIRAQRRPRKGAGAVESGARGT